MKVGAEVYDEDIARPGAVVIGEGAFKPTTRKKGKEDVKGEGRKGGREEGRVEPGIKTMNKKKRRVQIIKHVLKVQNAPPPPPHDRWWSSWSCTGLATTCKYFSICLPSQSVLGYRSAHSDAATAGGLDCSHSDDLLLQRGYIRNPYGTPTMCFYYFSSKGGVW